MAGERQTALRSPGLKKQHYVWASYNLMPNSRARGWHFPAPKTNDRRCSGSPQGFDRSPSENRLPREIFSFPDSPGTPLSYSETPTKQIPPQAPSQEALSVPTSQRLHLLTSRFRTGDTPGAIPSTPSRSTSEDLLESRG